MCASKLSGAGRRRHMNHPDRAQERARVDRAQRHNLTAGAANRYGRNRACMSAEGFSSRGDAPAGRPLPSVA